MHGWKTGCWSDFRGALACGTPMVFDLSRGVMPQESNNLNFWKSRGEGVLTMKEPNLLPNVLGQKIPRIRIELPSSPSELIFYWKHWGRGMTELDKTQVKAGRWPVRFSVRTRPCVRAATLPIAFLPNSLSTTPFI